MSGPAIWRVPLAILAGLTALAGLGLGAAAPQLPAPWGAALPWGFAGASLTFVVIRIVHTGRVTRRELELIVLAGGIFVAPYFLLAALGVAALAVALLLVEGLRRTAEVVVPPVSGVAPAAPPRDSWDPPDEDGHAGDDDDERDR